jgi:prepilin-type N-terminal cleavage/methylation domain-containing protein
MYGGFTLIEFNIVLVILAVIAGRVIPVPGMLGLSADRAAGAHTQCAVAANVQEYFVLQKRYPQGPDSLLVDGGHRVDATLAALDNLDLGALSSNRRRPFSRGGFGDVHDMKGAAISSAAPYTLTGDTNANHAGQYRRVVPASGTRAACVIGEEGGATWNRVPEPGIQLVAAGIGPNFRIVPTTMLNAPTYPGSEGKYFGRCIATFQVYESGERCVLVGVPDAYGRTPDHAKQQFSESLPNGGRAG